MTGSGASGDASLTIDESGPGWSAERRRTLVGVSSEELQPDLLLQP